MGFLETALGYLVTALPYIFTVLSYIFTVLSHLISALLIGLAILIHEFGHLLAAWWTKIPVARFSVGIGPKLWGFRRGETDYWLSAIPLGGYVLPAVEDHDEFVKYPIGSRLIFALGGPVANIALAFVCLAIYNSVQNGLSFDSVLIQPLSQIVLLIGAMLQAIGGLFTGGGQVSGVVGIVAVGGGIVSKGFLGMIKFLTALSISLAVFNMLPIPPLDGGKIVMYLAEKLDRRFLWLHERLAIVGILLILGLMIYATYGDVQSLLN